MRRIALITLLAAILSTPSLSQRILGYYPYYITGEENNIQYDKLTDIVYAFLQLDGNGNLASGNYFITSQFATVRNNAHLEGVKVHASIGGGGQPSNDLAWIAADPAKRATMVADLTDFVSGNHTLNNVPIAGIDIDWEYPTDAAKRAQHEALLSELRTALDAQGAIDGVHYEISIAIGGDVLSPTSHADYINAAAFQYCDLVSIMTYDLGYMSQYGGDHASYQAMVDGISHYMGMGLQADQLMVGVPFYGRQSGGWTAQDYDVINSSGSQAIFEGSSSGGYLYDGKDELEAKTDYVMGTIGGVGITIWELTADRHDQYSLLSALATKMDEYGCSAPQPDLGADASICGVGSITLNSGVSTAGGRSFSWTFNGGTIGSATSPSYTASAAGTYEVTVTEGGCSKSDEVVISGQLPTPNLGGGIDLCNPSTATLDANVSGSGLTFAWEKDNQTIQGETSSTLTVSAAGTYEVTVSASGCGSESDNVVVTSSLPEVTGDEICSAGSVTLTASEPVDWYADASNGSPLETNSTTFTTTITQSETFYVEATGGSVDVTLGKTSLTGGWYANSQVYAQRFEVFQTLTLASVDLDMEGSGNVFVNILQSDGSTQEATTGSISVGSGVQTVPVGVTLDPGVYYLTTEGTSRNLYVDPAESTSPYEETGIISIEGTAYEDWSGNGYTLSLNYGQVYNWVVSSGSACERVSVEAVINSGIGCGPTCTTPTSVSIAESSPLGFCAGNSVDVTPQSTGGTFQYELLRNGVPYDGPGMVSTFSINQSGSYTIIASDPADAATCYLESSSFTVNENDVPDQPSQIVGSSDLCETESNLTYSVTNVPGLTYDWAYDGSGVTLVENGSLTALHSSMGAVSGDLSVTASNECGAGNASSLSITIHEQPGNPQAFTQSSAIVTAGDLGVAYSIASQSDVTYNWNYTGTGVSINGSSNAVTLDFASNASDGEVQVYLESTHCSASAVLSMNVEVQTPLSLFDENRETVMSLYPNPVGTQLEITFGEVRGEVIVSLISPDGKLIRDLYQGEVAKNLTREEDVSDLAEGLYFISIQTESHSSMQRFVIQH